MSMQRDMNGAEVTCQSPTSKAPPDPNKANVFMDRAEDLNIKKVLAWMANYYSGRYKEGTRWDICECERKARLDQYSITPHDQRCPVVCLVTVCGVEEDLASLRNRAEEFARWCVSVDEHPGHHEFDDVEHARWHLNKDTAGNEFKKWWRP